VLAPRKRSALFEKPAMEKCKIRRVGHAELFAKREIVAQNGF